jgi:hypothetical protein
MRLPAVRLAPGVDQVLVIDGRVVTFWEFVKESVEPTTLTDLGHTLRTLHDLEIPVHLDLPVSDPFGRVDERLAAAAGAAIAVDDVAFLRRRLAELRTDYESLEFALPEGHIHGDAHARNREIALTCGFSSGRGGRI